MTNDIGYSSIYPLNANAYNGPIGATGATGATGTPGATGVTGINSNYISDIFVDKTTGLVTFTFSDDTLDYSVGILKGPTGTYAGLTATSVGGYIPVLHGVCGGITLDFYNFQTDGLLGVTTDTDGSLKFTISPNTSAGGISFSTENNRIVYVKENTYIMSTDLIPENTTSISGINGSSYPFINFGGETAGRNVVTDITESVVSVGPVHRGEIIVNNQPFFNSTTTGLEIDLSYATVYRLITPIGIKSFNTNNSPIPTGQVMSVTLIVEGDDVWNFPDAETVVFDTNSNGVFYPGTNIVHMWKSAEDLEWKASITARGFGITGATNPGLRGSCCYFDVDQTKHCEDYVTENYCIERNGTFEGMTPCDKNSCVVDSKEKLYDGICCSEGRCISDIDPSLCSTIGGYFISGITCGDYGAFPDNDADNTTGLCFNKCKPSTICCKNGECFGQLTKVHCEEIIGGKIVYANNCFEANCCDHVEVSGACCIPNPDGTFECQIVSTPYECNTQLNGVFMGNNTKCENNICCKVPIATCKDCVLTPTGCNCVDKPIYSGTCSSNGLLETCASCLKKQCFKCDCITNGCSQLEACVQCPEGYTEGNCTTNPCQNLSKTCYGECINDECDSEIVAVECSGKTCQELADQGKLKNTALVYDYCQCGERHAACFWCFADGNTGITFMNEDRRRFATPIELNRELNVGDNQAPYRSVLLVNPQVIHSLDQNIPTIVKPKSQPEQQIQFEFTPDGDKLAYYIEDWTNIDNGVFKGLTGTTDGTFQEKYLNFGQQVVTTKGKFKCYYIGGYLHNPEDVSQNRSNCLTKFGYSDESCLLCDPVDTFTTNNNDTVFNSLINVSSVEPYSDEIKSGQYAPFPPIWGRITYGWGQRGCDNGTVSKLTYNLKLLRKVDIQNLCIYAKTGKISSYLGDLLQLYRTNPSQIYSNMTYGLAEEIGIEKVTGQFVQSPERESCLISPIFKYDPYGIAGGYYPQFINGAFVGLTLGEFGSTLLSGYPQDYTPTKACDLCSDNRIWYLTTYSDSIDTNKQTKIGYNFGSNSDNITDIFCPQPGNYDDPYSIPDTLASVGEIYFKTESDVNTNTTRGILGRNLRYNWDIFRNITVFTDSGGERIIKESPNITIPIYLLQGWFLPSPNCAPMGACGVACTSLPSCGGVGPGNYGGDGGAGDGGNYSSILQAFAQSILEPNNPFTFRSSSAPITTKSVQILPGICVEMICPECSMYESC